MPQAPTRPPATPSVVPIRNPARRPARAIHIEAGNIIVAVPRNMVAMGSVAQRGDAAICPPARPPTVITITDTIWNRACAQARISTWRCMGFLSMSFFALLFYSSTRDGAQALGHGVDLCLRGAAPQAEAHCAHADLLGHAHGGQHGRAFHEARMAGRDGDRKSTRL